MKTMSVAVSPPYSLVLLLDPSIATIPQTMADNLIVATDSCIAIGCTAEDDGSTEVTLGPAQAVDPGYSPAFEGAIQTPSGVLEIQSVLGETILQTQVQDQETQVVVWVNDQKEPDKIVIGLKLY